MAESPPEKWRGAGNESSGIGKKDLRQVQGDSQARRGARHLRQPEAQAAPGIKSLTHFRN
jgi:hypothetical protein